jgi:hypothetical protein
MIGNFAGKGLMVILFSGHCMICTAQSTQLWADFTLNIPTGNHTLLSNQLSYRSTELKGQKWREVNINPIVQWSINRHFDAMAGLTGAFTHQKNGFNTIEIKPEFGLRYHLFPDIRVQFRALARLEQRNFYLQEAALWNHSLRSRFRIECLVPINKSSMLFNQLWYAIADAEVFWAMDEEINERFSNQRRFRLGGGYRLSDLWRFEFIYTYQVTRNFLETGFQQSSNVFRLRVRMFLHHKKSFSEIGD